MAYFLEMIQSQKLEDRKAFAKGLIAGASYFALWEDGKQSLGVSGITLEELTKEVEEFMTNSRLTIKD